MVFGMVGTWRRVGLVWQCGWNAQEIGQVFDAEGQSRAPEDVKQKRDKIRLSLSKDHSGSSEGEPWGH